MTLFATLYNLTIGHLIDKSTFDEYEAKIDVPAEDIWGKDEKVLELLKSMLSYFEAEHAKTANSRNRQMRLAIFITRLKHNIKITSDIIEYKQALSVLRDRAA